MKIYWRVVLLLFALALLVFLFPDSQHASADGGAPNLAYVAGAAHGISAIDIGQQKVTSSIAVNGDPQMVLLSLDGRYLYVTQPTLGRVSIISARTGKTLCTASLPGQPSLLALSLDATVLYVAGREDTSVRVLDPTTCAIQQTFETHEPVYGLAVTASTAADATPSTPHQLWITGTTSLTIFDVNGHLLGSVPIAGGPQDISIPGGFTAYVTTRQGTVVAVDLNSRRVVRTLLSGGQFGPMDYDANTGEVYVPDRQHNQLDVLAPIVADTTVTQQEPARIIRLSSSPQSVAITSDGQLGFVALSDGKVIMLDVPSRQIVNTLIVGGTPHFIITGLYPPLLGSTPQEASTWNTLIDVAAIVVLLVLIVGSILLIRRNVRNKVEHKDEDEDSIDCMEV